MRRLVLALAIHGLFGCERRAYSDPPPALAESPASSANSFEALFGPSPADAGAAVTDSSHAMTVTLCARSPEACGAPEAGTSDGSYRVVFGSGRGGIRSRGQAMTDLYEELRNRTSLGQRLDAEPHTVSLPDASGAPRARSTTKVTPGGSDPIIQCAFRLLDLVDSAGEVTLDRIHGAGSRGCLVSLGGSVGDGGASQCLIDEPERPRPRDRGGLSF
jgi:hypothetical protein